MKYLIILVFSISIIALILAIISFTKKKKSDTYKSRKIPDTLAKVCKSEQQLKIPFDGCCTFNQQMCDAHISLGDTTTISVYHAGINGYGKDNVNNQFINLVTCAAKNNGKQTRPAKTQDFILPCMNWSHVNWRGVWIQISSNGHYLKLYSTNSLTLQN